MRQDDHRWNSEDYAKHSSVQYEWAQELLPTLNLQGTESLLDIGCGEGKVTYLLASCLPNGHVTGIDSSEDMISSAKQSFPESKHRNLTFLLKDVRSLDFENRFDVAFSSAALHWVTYHMSFLKRVSRSLKKSGRLLFQMGGEGNAKDIISVLDELLTVDPWKPYFENFSFPYGFYGPDDYSRWLAEVGLKEKRLELIPKNMRQKGKDGLAGWIRTTWLPYTERLPSELRDRFISEIVDSYIKTYPMDSEGYVHVKMVRLEVEATNT
jgi:trans-aconitate methyltransferase